MQRGSLIMLAKAPDPRDYLKAADLGIELPKKDVIYTVAKGPFLTVNNGTGRSVLAIEIEELPGNDFTASFFVEVQEPMKVDVNEILVTKNTSDAKRKPC